MSDPKCNHARKGIVTNQPNGYDRAQPHAAASVCDRPACIEDAKFWVAGSTNQPAVFLSDSHE